MTSEIMTFCHDLQISEKVYAYFYLSFTGKTRHEKRSRIFDQMNEYVTYLKGDII